MSSEALSAFIQGTEDTPPNNEEKTLDGACVALHEAVETYTSALKGGLGRKTKDNAEWKRVVGKHLGLARISQKRWDSISDRVVEMGLLEIVESEGGRHYWKVAPPKEEGEGADPEKEQLTANEEEESENDPEEDRVSFEYDPADEPSEEDGWGGFNEEELEIIEILNTALLRGHTPSQQRATFYNAHIYSLCRNEPLSVRARIRDGYGGSVGYCCNNDGRYTGGLMNCAVLSANMGMGIMPNEDKEKVKAACITPCPNCPNKRYARSK